MPSADAVAVFSSEIAGPTAGRCKPVNITIVGSLISSIGNLELRTLCAVAGPCPEHGRIRVNPAGRTSRQEYRQRDGLAVTL